MILLVEDNPLHRKMYSAALRSHGYTVIAVEDEREAVERACHVRPQVAVIDILLPFIDGREIIAEMRRGPQTRTVPILAISAGADPDLQPTCISAGADRFQAKPTSLRKFIQNIDIMSGKPERDALG